MFSPLPGSFTYIWPADLGEPVAGIRVLVPFGRSKRHGLVKRALPQPADISSLRLVEDRLDVLPPYDAVRRRWLERVRRYYLATSGDVLSTALAWAGVDETRRFRCPDIDLLESVMPSLKGAFKRKNAISLKTIMQRAAGPYVWHNVARACEKKLLNEMEQSAQLVGKTGERPALKLTDEQQKAVYALIESAGKFQPFLLFGRTGSGKTEVYLQAAESVISGGGQVLVLVPEIGLTPMWISRLIGRFDHVAVWHSALTTRERLAVVQNLAQTDVLIGTRSALFLPLGRLALIAVDEEHDASFKQQDGMAYSARDMSILLAQELNIPVVMGSATPSLECWHQAAKGRYKRLDLSERIAKSGVSLRPEIVDMRQVDGPVSPALLAALKNTEAAGEQAILFLNRRGYAPALQCTACGDVPGCPACSMRLTLHRRAGRLRCHSCGYSRRTPRSCELCGEAAFMPLGAGTEKLDDWLAESMPSLRFARFDRDMITSHSRLTKTLAAFEQGELDCLVGTQMLVKGHDFPNVTLVGVINADLGVNMPDFRAAERWWQQMIQITGRAGRGGKPGRVLIQTRLPDAPWLSRIDESQAEAAIGEELHLREALSYPPFSRWVRVIFSATKAERASSAAEQFASQCSVLTGVSVSESMPCCMERVAGRFRFEVLLRDPSRRVLPWKLEPVLAGLKVPSGVHRRVDVDPQDMM